MLFGIIVVVVIIIGWKPLIFDARLNWINRMNGMLDFFLSWCDGVWVCDDAEREWKQRRGGKRRAHTIGREYYAGQRCMTEHGGCHRTECEREWLWVFYRCGVREPLKCCFHSISTKQNRNANIFCVCVCMCIQTKCSLSYSIFQSGGAVVLAVATTER